MGCRADRLVEQDQQEGREPDHGHQSLFPIRFGEDESGQANGDVTEGPELAEEDDQHGDDARRPAFPSGIIVPDPFQEVGHNPAHDQGSE